MSHNFQPQIDAFLEQVEARNPHEPEFHQAVKEIALTVIPFIEENHKYKEANIFHRIVEAERMIIFRVPWVDDNGNVQVNRGMRVQFNSAIGPYKGGTRFHPSVNLSILKFLGFEQVFKNALTRLPLGGGKGGADFDPKGKSDNEVMRFCQSYMNELQHHIGSNTDIPGGDIGVGPREIGFMFGQYKRLKNEFTGIFTGKGVDWGGSFIRTESTGYGTAYFIAEMLDMNGENFKGKTVVVSGSGNVAQYVIEKIIQMEGKVITASDSSGYVFAPDGIGTEHLEYLKELKNVRRGRIREMADKFGEISYFEGEKVWNLSMEVDVAIPCATENELNEEDAEKLIKRGVNYVGEGANMPCTFEAVERFRAEGVIFGPGKAVNAGGVSTSGLEMSQNAIGMSWGWEKVDEKLQNIMKDIHQQCVEYGKNKQGEVDYMKGANLAGFVKVADAMIDQGVV